MKKICERCEQEFVVEKRQWRKRYCSYKCSNAHHDFKKMGKLGGLAIKTKDKTKLKLRGWGKDRRGNPGKRSDPERLRKIGIIGGVNSAKKQAVLNRSKGEAYLAELLKNNYKVRQSVWDLIKGYEIDIFLPDQKVAISYNGAVHIRPIYGQARLNQVINRDRYRDKKLKELGFKHIVIEDNGKFNKERVEEYYKYCLAQLAEVV